MLIVQIEVGALRDVRAYYDAATRLNEGLPLYPAGADPDAADFYRYPPLLAILFRPLASSPSRRSLRSGRGSSSPAWSVRSGGSGPAAGRLG